MTIDSAMKSLADAVRGKTGISGKLSISGMTDAVNSIELNTGGDIDFSGVNVTAGDLRNGVVAINSSGIKITGNIQDVELQRDGNTVSIAQGYTQGGSVTIEQQETDMPDALVTLTGNVVSISGGYTALQRVVIPLSTVTETETSVTIGAGYVPKQLEYELGGSEGGASVRFACIDRDGILRSLDMNTVPPVPDGQTVIADRVTIDLPANISTDDWYDPLTVIALENGTVRLEYINTNGGSVKEESLEAGIYYRKSTEENWQNFYIPRTVYLAAGEILQFRTFTQPTESDKVFFRPLGEYFNFSFTNQVKVTGNIMSLGNFADFCTPYCFDRLFAGCSTMIQAPRLPAVKLAAYCYREMFEGCTGLVTAPELPAAELAKYCYSGMFKNCTSLNEIKVNFTSWDSTQNNTWDWLKNTSATGTFIKPEALPEVFGEHEIPENWQVTNISNEDN